MQHVVVFFAILFFLFFLSRHVTRGFSYLLYRVVGHHKSAIFLFALFFFPGTFVHELSHYVTAVVLRVRVGKMEFVPEIQGESVKMGSVSIAQTDPVRRFLIGVAPVVWGVVIMLGLIYFVLGNGIFSNLWLSGGLLLLMFIIGNTMYSSKRDMEGAVGLFAVVGLFIAVIGGFFWYTGTSLPDVHFSFLNGEIFYSLFETGWKFLLVPLVVDVVLLLVFSFTVKR